MTAKPVVVSSYNLDGEMRCVDIFRRADGSYGFEEYRRDPEDGRGWYPVGGHAMDTFRTQADALARALDQVAWLADVLPGDGEA